MIHSGEAALQNQTHRPCLLPANYWQSLGGKQRATAQEPSPQGKAARMSNRWLCKWLHPISTSIICTPLRSLYETVPGTGSCIGTYKTFSYSFQISILRALYMCHVKVQSAAAFPRH